MGGDKSTKARKLSKLRTRIEKVINEQASHVVDSDHRSIDFGNGITGRKPPMGASIRTSYRMGSGKSGSESSEE